MKIPWSRKLILLLFSIGFALVMCEVFLQIMHRLSYSSPLPYGIRDESRMRIDTLALNPSFSGVSRNGIVYITNARGFRDDEIDPEANHIIFLGDSTTFGLNINHENTYPEIFEQFAKKDGLNFQAINMAAPGQGTLDQLVMLQNILNDKRLKIKGVVLGFFPNDFSDSFQTSQFQENQNRGGLVFRIKMLLRKTIGIPRLYRYLVVVKERLATPSHSQANRAEEKSVFETQPGPIQISNDSVNNPNPLNSQVFESEPGREIEWDWLTEEQLKENKTFQAVIQAIDAINQLCRAKNIPFLFLFMPTRVDEIFSSQRARYKILFEANFKKENILYLDLVQIYRDYLKINNINNILPKGFYSYQEDLGHPGPLACQLIGQSIYKKLIPEDNKTETINYEKH